MAPSWSAGSERDRVRARQQTLAQLGEISLSGFTATSLDSFGNVTFTVIAVPEPTTWVAGVLMLAVLRYSQRRQMRRWLVLAGLGLA